MSRHFFIALDSRLFVFFLCLVFWFSCAFSCSSEPVTSQTRTSIHESASLFAMAQDLNFSISVKNVSQPDLIIIANEVSTFINNRSSKIVVLNEISSLNALDLNVLVRMNCSQPKTVKRTLMGYFGNAFTRINRDITKHLTCNVTICESEQTKRLELSDCKQIVWNFCCSSSPVLTVLSSEAQSNVTEQQQNPNGVGQAAAAAVFSCDGAAAEASLNLSGIESETSSMTAAGANPRPFMVAKTYKADLRLCRKCRSEHQHRSRAQQCDASRPLSSGGLLFSFRRASNYK